MKKTSFLFIFLLLIVSSLFCQDKRLIGTWQIVDINPASPLSKTVDTTKTDMKTILSTLESIGISTQITFNSDTYYETLNGIRYVRPYKVKNDFIITTVNDTELHQPYNITGNRLTLNDFIYEIDLPTTAPVIASIPSAEFDLIMGCLENNAERVKYAIERGAYLDNQTTWFYVIPEHEAKIAYRSLIFWWYKLDKDYGINITYKDIDDNIDRFDIDAGFPIVWIPIINQNIEILSVLATSEKYKVFFNDLAEDIKNIPSTEKPKIESGLENGLFEAIRSEQFVRFLNDISK